MSKENAGLSPRRKTWEERMGDCQKYYTLARTNGACSQCGVQGRYLKIGPHPSGQGGRPVKLVGPDMEKLKQWIKDAGWLCQRCALKVQAVAPGAVEVKLKPWEPYPESLREENDWVEKQLEKMKTGSDGMGVRSDQAILDFLSQRRGSGWITPEKWFSEREVVVAAPPCPGSTSPEGGEVGAGGGVELSGVGSNIES